MHAKLLAIIFGLATIVLVTPADAKTKHLSLNHTQKHAAAHHHSPKNEILGGFIDTAAIAPYPNEITSVGPRGEARRAPMGRKFIAPSNGYSMASDERIIGGRHPGDPYAFCGAEAARYVFGEAKRDLWPAANWIAKFSRASPAPGMAAARRHHVMILMSHVSGSDWLVHDGNSGGHMTREHVRSIVGYIIVDPHSGQSFFARRHQVVG